MCDDRDNMKGEPLSPAEKFALGALIAVSALWGVLLWKIGGWIVWWVKSLW